MTAAPLFAVLYPNPRTAEQVAGLYGGHQQVEITRVTFWTIGVGVRHAAWVLRPVGVSDIALGMALMKSWHGQQFFVGIHPARGVVTEKLIEQEPS